MVIHHQHLATVLNVKTFFYQELGTTTVVNVLPVMNHPVIKKHVVLSTITIVQVIVQLDNIVRNVMKFNLCRVTASHAPIQFLPQIHIYRMVD